MSQEFVRQVAGHCAALRGIAGELRSLSHSFEHTGNERMAETMHELSRSISSLSEQLSKGHDDNLSAEHQQAMSGMAGILTACLNRDESDARKAQRGRFRT